MTPSSLLCGVTMKSSNLAPKGDGDCDMVCKMLHTVLGGNIEVYAEANLRLAGNPGSLTKFLEATLSVGMEGLELQIPEID